MASGRARPAKGLADERRAQLFLSAALAWAAPAGLSFLRAPGMAFSEFRIARRAMVHAASSWASAISCRYPHASAGAMESPRMTRVP